MITKVEIAARRAPLPRALALSADWLLVMSLPVKKVLSDSGLEKGQIDQVRSPSPARLSGRDPRALDDLAPGPPAHRQHSGPMCRR